MSIYTYFLSALEILILAFRYSQVITEIVYLRKWSVSTHINPFLNPCFLFWKTTILDLEKGSLFHLKAVKLLKNRGRYFQYLLAPLFYTDIRLKDTYIDDKLLDSVLIYTNMEDEG